MKTLLIFDNMDDFQQLGALKGSTKLVQQLQEYCIKKELKNTRFL